MDLSNPARARLEAGELSIGVGIKQGRTVDIAPIMKVCGFDWLFLDLEHGALSTETVAQISVAAIAAGISPIVRIPIGGYALASRLLDSGALGIVLPHVESVEEASTLVRELRFPPEGHRGVSGTFPQFGYRRVAVADAVPELNRQTLLSVMLETPQAISRADEIAAVPGIDIVMIGTNDLAMALGRPSQFDHPDVVGAYETVAAACRRHGKWLGSGGIGDIKLAHRYIAMGVAFFLASHDVGLILAAGGQKVTALREGGNPG
jgi:2-keto-3-deoxy-L-rhamnonate aldolase RhmA